MKKHEEYRPTKEQLDSQRLTTERVQFWRNGIMLTCEISLKEAQEMVREGKAFVMTSQAIGAIKGKDNDYQP